MAKFITIQPYDKKEDGSTPITINVDHIISYQAYNAGTEIKVTNGRIRSTDSTEKIARLISEQ